MIHPFLNRNEYGLTAPTAFVRGFKSVFAPRDMYWGASVGYLTVLTNVSLWFFWLMCHVIFYHSRPIILVAVRHVLCCNIRALYSAAAILPRYRHTESATAEGPIGAVHIVFTVHEVILCESLASVADI
jgi:hypothetical protein